MYQNLFHFQHPATLPAAMYGWLDDPGSFMQRLRNHGAINPCVQIIQEWWQLPEVDECNALKLDFQTISLVREVLIASEELKWMYARTVFPPQTLTGEQKELAQLQNRSLGSVLFNDPTLQRSPFEFASLQPGMKWYDKVAASILRQPKELWARRSLFCVSDKPLLLTEIFLPDVEKLGL